MQVDRREEWARVLDFLPEGMQGAHFRDRAPTIVAIGEKRFTLLNLEPLPGAQFSVADRAYVGGQAELENFCSRRVRARLTYNELTTEARGELPVILEEIISENEAEYLRFFNESNAISPRFHALELLPHIGKKTMELIIAERRKKRFDSFADLQERGKVPHPIKLISERILHELQTDNERYRIYTRPPAEDDRRRF